MDKFLKKLDQTMREHDERILFLSTLSKKEFESETENEGPVLYFDNEICSHFLACISDGKTQKERRKLFYTKHKELDIITLPHKYFNEQEKIFREFKESKPNSSLDELVRRIKKEHIDNSFKFVQAEAKEIRKRRADEAAKKSKEILGIGIFGAAVFGLLFLFISTLYEGLEEGKRMTEMENEYINKCRANYPLRSRESCADSYREIQRFDP